MWSSVLLSQTANRVNKLVQVYSIIQSIRGSSSFRGTQQLNFIFNMLTALYANAYVYMHNEVIPALTHWRDTYFYIICCNMILCCYGKVRKITCQFYGKGRIFRRIHNMDILGKDYAEVVLRHPVTK